MRSVPAISTARLDLAPMSPSFLEALLAGRPGIAEGLGGFLIPHGWPDEQDARMLALRLSQLREDPEAQEWLVRAIVLRGPPRQMIGHIGFHGKPAGFAELGYTVFEEHRRQGYAQEAIEGMMEWAASRHGVRRFRLFDFAAQRALARPRPQAGVRAGRGTVRRRGRPRAGVRTHPAGGRHGAIIGSMAEAAAPHLGRKTSADGRRPPRIIAVDGSAASGKSTIGRRLAAYLGYPFLDTGVMYRAVTYAALREGVDLDDADALSALASRVRIDVRLPGAGEEGPARVYLDGEDVTDRLRAPEVEESVSIVSRVAGVREALVEKQRRIADAGPIVMAGRDIGTVVLPDADLKIYLDASLEERAARRHREFETLGRTVSKEEVLADIRRRDQIDSERAVSPLRPADDAVIIETDGLSQDDVLARVVSLIADGR